MIRFDELTNERDILWQNDALQLAIRRRKLVRDNCSDSGSDVNGLIEITGLEV